jgi:proline dehydrogenase
METSRMSRNLTARFVAGQSLEDGARVLSQLWAERVFGTLDFLGENVSSLDDAARSRDAYLEAIETIRQARVPATVSLKLTQFGLDFSKENCRGNVAALVEKADLIGGRIEIDMESSPYTDRTLAMVFDLHDRYPGRVRAVIQAYLYRSEADIRQLSDRGIPVRLCKGAYREPPTIAYPKKADVDANYLKLAKQLLDGGTYPAIASHDETILRELLQYINSKRIAPDRFEFQMLYGIRRDLQQKLVSDGFRLRLYVPYGDAWYPYFMRRLAERPANMLFLAKNLIRT